MRKVIIIKILTYENPHDYDLIMEDKKIYNHINLTASQTLANAIMSSVPENKSSNIITIKKLIDEFEITGTNNNIIKKYNIISEYINDIEDKEIKNSIINEKHGILESIDTINLLGIDADNLSGSYGNKTLSMAVKIIKTLSNKTEFSLNKPDEKFFKQKLQTLLKNDSNNIYIHGVHQFTPGIIFLIKLFKLYNFNITFIYNHYDKYKKIYKSWDTIYKNLPIIKREKFKMERIFLESKDANIAKYLQGNLDEIKAYNDLRLKEFSTLNELTHFVSKEYEKGKKINPEKPLTKMNIQFYGVNGSKSNSLLKLIYPEQFKERHFLSYPIGQFIMSIYDSWDNKKETIIVDQNFRSILAFDIWNKNPISMFDKIRILKKEDLTIEEYIDFLNNQIKVLENFNKFYKNNKITYLSEISKVAFYNYKLKDLELYKKIIEELKDLVINIFGFKNDSFNIKRHIEKMISYLYKNYTSRNDKELLDSLKSQIDSLDNNTKIFSVDDLKESIFILYNVNFNSEKTSNWIIRDFEQLDREVFLKKTYNNKIHLAQLSEEEINNRVRENELWPADIILKDINLNNNWLNLYIDSKLEYGNFIRFMLFYATYYSKKEIEYSYIKLSKGEKNKPIYFFRNIGFEIEHENGYEEDDLVKESNLKSLYLMNKKNECKLKLKYEEIDSSSHYYIDEIQIRKYLKYLIAMCAGESVVKYKRKHPNSELTPNIVHELSTGFFDKFYSYYIDMFIGFGKTNADEIYKDSKKYYFKYVEDHIYKIVKRRINEDKLDRHRKYNKNKIMDLIDNKTNLNEENLTSMGKKYKIDEFLCKNCAYRNICLTDYEEDDY